MPSRNATHDGTGKKMSIKDRVKKFNRLDKESRGEEVNWTQSNLNLDVWLSDKSELSFDEQLHHFCKSLDRNADDLIDLKEFKTYYPSSSDLFFSRIDTNGNTKILRQELQALFTKEDNSADVARLGSVTIELHKRMINEFMKEFDKFCDIVDQNHDNVISMEEFQLVNPEGAQKIFSELDLNHDDMLSKEEFCEMFRLDCGVFDLPHMSSLRDNVLERINAQFDVDFEEFLILLGFDIKSSDTLSFSDLKKDNPAAFAALFKAIGISEQMRMKASVLKKQFALMDGTWDTARLSWVQDNVQSQLNTEPLPINTGWNTVSQPFAVYSENNLQSKKIYSGVRGEEIYVTEVGSEWVAVSSPMPGWIRFSRKELKYVSQVKQFVSPVSEELPGESEGVFHAKPKRQLTMKNLVSVVDEDDKFVFPHGMKFEIEFGWFQTLPYGLNIYEEDKEAVLYTLVSGEEIHIVSREGPWVHLDSPMDGYLKCTNDENKVVIKTIRNFITKLTEKLTTKAVDKHEKIAEDRKKRKEARREAKKPKWKAERPKQVTIQSPKKKAEAKARSPEVSDIKESSDTKVRSPEVAKQTFRKYEDEDIDEGGAEIPVVSSVPVSGEAGTAPVMKDDPSISFFTVVAEMSENRRRIRQLQKTIQLLNLRQGELQNEMLDEFDHVKEVVTHKNMSMEDLTNTFKDTLSSKFSSVPQPAPPSTIDGEIVFE